MFVPHHSLVTAEGVEPRRWMLVLHGIYGSGGNWRTFARKLTARRRDWGVVLVDLRKHGKSQAAPPPYTVAAAAGDLFILAKNLSYEDKSIAAVCGHSFGGKVALQYRADAGADLAQTWVLDASPSSHPRAMEDPDNSVATVLQMLKDMPPAFADRAEFVAEVQKRGFPALLGNWLAMNLEPTERSGEEAKRSGASRTRQARAERSAGVCRYTSRLDLPAVELLLRDYYRCDLWPAVESGPGEVNLVIAGQSRVWQKVDRTRVEQLAAKTASVKVTRLERSGHWVHIEALADLLDAIASELPH